MRETIGKTMGHRFQVQEARNIPESFASSGNHIQKTGKHKGHPSKTSVDLDPLNCSGVNYATHVLNLWLLYVSVMHQH
eukprot:3730300-Pyramimonas_sp.AAC.1